MAALLHDLVDTALHSSKLGPTISISNPYVHWLCIHHHSVKDYPQHLDLLLLQDADVRTSRYARINHIPIRNRQLISTNTAHLAVQLEKAANHSVYRLYSFIYHSQELNRLTASKAHPTETLRHHLIVVANWTLFLLRISSRAAAHLAGQSGAIPDPVEAYDPQTSDEPPASW